MTNNLNAKLFVGFFLKPDLHAKLEKSLEWKKSRIAPSDKDLIEITEKNKNYIGIYINSKSASFKALQQTEEQLKEMLQIYLPCDETHDLQIEIFSKLFVS